MIRILLIFCTLLFFSNTPVIAQKGSLKKATQLFRENKYAAAIPYYQKALNEKKNLSTKAKLAYCYKVTNQMEKATLLYEEIVQHERAKTKYYYYYAETLMSSGNYDEAKKWFKKFAAIETEDESVGRMIESCDYAKTVPPYFGNVVVNSFLQNSEADDNAPVFFNQGIVFTSDRDGKFKLLDTKSGATGRSYLHLYYSEQQADGSYGKPKEYVSKVNDVRKNTGMATFQEDGSSMFFTRNGIHLNKANSYCLQLFEVKGENGKNWKSSEVLPFCSINFNYMHPAISPDGQSLYFVSDKPNGVGGTDIYVSKKSKKGWGKPQNLGEQVNTEGNEGFPFLHQNGKLYFCSKGHLGLGGYDVFVTQKNKDGEWEKPTNLGAPINSPADDVSIFLDSSMQKGLFTSSREGGDDDIFLLSFAPSSIAIQQESNPATSIPKESVSEVVSVNEEISLVEEKEEIIAPPVESIEERALIKKNEATITKDEIPKIEQKEEAIPPPPVEIIEKKPIAVVKKIDFLTTYTWKKEQFQKGLLFGLPTIQFRPNEYFVTYKIAAELDLAASILKKYPFLNIEIGVHTANLGAVKERETLTRYRAEAIIGYLEKKGIRRYRMTSKGYGGQQPLNNCLSEEDCSLEQHSVNDRVEIKIMPK